MQQLSLYLKVLKKKIECPKSFEIADILLYSLLIFFD